ncbi:MAG: hypothetical protein KC636_30325 [Myxococcales bacterium]|nr:hypothetical protein [Myxococcales bacterium]
MTDWTRVARAALLAGALACGGDGGSTTAATADTAMTTATTSAATSEATAATAEAASDASSETAAIGEGVCVRACAEPRDCCPPDVVECPGEYPHAWSCEQGLCVAGGCTNDEQCAALSTVPGVGCHAIEGVGVCFTPCAGDGDCAVIPGSTCSGLADDGVGFCRTGCESDADCEGAGRCELASGSCRCADDVDCTAREGLVCALAP